MVRWPSGACLRPRGRPAPCPLPSTALPPPSTVLCGWISRRRVAGPRVRPPLLITPALCVCRLLVALPEAPPRSPPRASSSSLRSRSRRFVRRLTCSTRTAQVCGVRGGEPGCVWSRFCVLVSRCMCAGVWCEPRAPATPAPPSGSVSGWHGCGVAAGGGFTGCSPLPLQAPSTRRS